MDENLITRGFTEFIACKNDIINVDKRQYVH